jgi:protein gp37
MSSRTKIQWCDSTVNPTMGCDGCEIWGALRKTCYAGTLHVRFGGVTPGYAPRFEEVTLFPGRVAEACGWTGLAGKRRIDKPWLGGLPRLIFVSDMSDSLSAAVPFEFLRDEIILNVAGERGRRHRWLWLTKRPDRMAQLSRWLVGEGIAWPENLWAGTSITSQATTSRIRHLVRVGDERTVRFLSVEPQVEAIDLSAWLPGLDWVIQGGESGHRARPFHVEWALDMIDQCERADVPLFLKQLGTAVCRRGSRLTLADNHGGDWTEWPEYLRVRRMPIQPIGTTDGPPGQDRPRGLGGDLPGVDRCGTESRTGGGQSGKRREAALKAWATRRARDRVED